ncbi:hypothetical protein P7_181 [Pectobacterium phage vB_PcaM_P7_Pc]|nr:hypothetical protein P7_181 [Pectobacterium phage vB_PcaM_P7_Pc]
MRLILIYASAGGPLHVLGMIIISVSAYKVYYVKWVSVA